MSLIPAAIQALKSLGRKDRKWKDLLPIGLSVGGAVLAWVERRKAENIVTLVAEPGTLLEKAALSIIQENLIRGPGMVFALGEAANNAIPQLVDGRGRPVDTGSSSSSSSRSTPGKVAAGISSKSRPADGRFWFAGEAVTFSTDPSTRRLTMRFPRCAAVEEFVAQVEAIIDTMKPNGGLYISGNYLRDLQPRRPVLDESQYDKLLTDARLFLRSKDWYDSVQVPWRRGYLLYGTPGSGKSTTAMALAADLRIDLTILDVAKDSVNHIGAVVRGRGGIVLLEDIDCAGLDRKNLTLSPDEEEAYAYHGARPTPVTTAELLRLLDGITVQPGTIFIATTNYRDRIDEAVLRPGRMDVQLEFGFATRRQVEELSRRFGLDGERLEEFVDRLTENKELTMAAVQGALLEEIGTNINNARHC